MKDLKRQAILTPAALHQPPPAARRERVRGAHAAIGAGCRRGGPSAAAAPRFCSPPRRGTYRAIPTDFVSGWRWRWRKCRGGCQTGARDTLCVSALMRERVCVSQGVDERVSAYSRTHSRAHAHTHICFLCCSSHVFWMYMYTYITVFTRPTAYTHKRGGQPCSNPESGSAGGPGTVGASILYYLTRALLP